MILAFIRGIVAGRGSAHREAAAKRRKRNAVLRYVKTREDKRRARKWFAAEDALAIAEVEKTRALHAYWDAMKKRDAAYRTFLDFI